MTSECWGCGEEVQKGNYCDICQISIKLIQRLQEDGSRILWVMPWMHAEQLHWSPKK